MKRTDKILDLCMRLLLFAYSVTMLGITVFQLKRDRQFLYIIGAFALILAGIYLFDGIYFLITRKRIAGLSRFIYGEQVEAEDAPVLKKVLVILLLLCVLVLSFYLFGVFVTVFVTMTLFPVLYDKRNIVVSLVLAAVVCGLFYYVFVQMMGLRLTPGLFLGF